jgi:hypothetical protein
MHDVVCYTFDVRHESKNFNFVNFIYPISAEAITQLTSQKKVLVVICFPKDNAIDKDLVGFCMICKDIQRDIRIF